MAAGVDRRGTEEPAIDVFTGPIRPRLEGHRLRTCGRERPPITSLDLGAEDADARYAWGANMTIRRSALERGGPVRGLARARRRRAGVAGPPGSPLQRGPRGRWRRLRALVHPSRARRPFATSPPLRSSTGASAQTRVCARSRAPRILAGAPLAVSTPIVERRPRSGVSSSRSPGASDTSFVAAARPG